MEHLTHVFHDLVVQFGYLGLFVVMFLGNLGAPVGTEVVMPAAGALAAQGHLPAFASTPAWVLVGVVGTIGELCGALTLYSIGHYGGLPFVHRYGKYVGFKEKELGHVQRFYKRFGHWAVLIARFVPFVRGVASFPAGLSRMPLIEFVPMTVLGSAVFCFGLAYVGLVAGKNLDVITASLHKVAIVVVIVVLVLAVGGVIWWRANAKKASAQDDPAV